MNVQFQKLLQAKFIAKMKICHVSKTRLKQSSYKLLYKAITKMNHYVDHLEDFSIHFSHDSCCTLVRKRTVLSFHVSDYEVYVLFSYICNHPPDGVEIKVIPELKQKLVNNYYKSMYLDYI